MKSPVLACVFAAALLSLGSLVHADEHERGSRGDGGGRWSGQQRSWQAQRADDGRWDQGQPRGRWRHPQAQPYPQQPYQDPRIDRHGPPPGYGAVPPPVQPQYAPPPQWQAPPPPRWNPQSRGFRPGDVLPPQYRQRQFVVNDWRAHRLYAPPPGYLWVQPEPGSYLLIGNNGTIANMLVGQ